MPSGSTSENFQDFAAIPPLAKVRVFAAAGLARLGSPGRRLLFAALIPLAAVGLQYALSPMLQPHVWLILFSAVFLSSWIAGLSGGLISTVLSGGLSLFFFQPSQISVPAAGDPKAFAIAGAFTAMGVIFSLSHHRLRMANRRTTLALQGALAESIRLKAAGDAAAASDRNETGIDFFSVLDKLGADSMCQEFVEASTGGEVLTKTVLDNLSVGVAVNSTDPTVKFIYMNDNFPRIYRTTREELSSPGAFWSAVYEEPAFRETMRKRVLDDCASGDPARMVWTDIPITRKDGSTSYVTARNIPVPGRGLMISMVGDVTERKHAESDLKLLRALIERSSDAIFVVDLATGRFLDVNESAHRSLGHTREQMLELTVFDIVVDFASETFFSTNEEIRRTGHVTMQARHIRRDGTTFPVEIALSQVSVEREYLLAIARDITERQQLEEKFRQAQKLEGIGQLAGGVAHDFNNILCAMIMQTELTEKVKDLPESVRADVRLIRTAAERAANLTRQLLLFSRKEVMQPRSLDLNEVVTSLAKMLQRIIREDIRLRLNLHPRPLHTRADPGMLDQVLMNLAVNARDAMLPAGGAISVETTATTVDEATARLRPDAVAGSYVTLIVRDTGCGIPPETLPHIFEPFFTTKVAGQGTGLGLATVFGIVKQHYGWIDIQSQPGQGTSFLIHLPAAPDPTGLPDEPEKAAGPTVGNETILVAEDDPTVRMLMCNLLKGRGYRVMEAGDGLEALQLWRANREGVALLLTDLVMPGGMSGQQLARELQAENPSLKVVFSSGYSEEIAGRAIELQNGENFLQKPFSPDGLVKAVRRTLDA